MYMIYKNYKCYDQKQKLYLPDHSVYYDQAQDNITILKLMYNKRSEKIVIFTLLTPIVDYTIHLITILILKCEGIIENISYERRVYESVDDSSQSLVKIFCQLPCSIVPCVSQLSRNNEHHRFIYKKIVKK